MGGGVIADLFLDAEQLYTQYLMWPSVKPALGSGVCVGEWGGGAFFIYCRSILGCRRTAVHTISNVAIGESGPWSGGWGLLQIYSFGCRRTAVHTKPNLAVSEPSGFLRVMKTTSINLFLLQL